MLGKNDPYQLQQVERLISSFSSKIVQPPLVVCSNMQELISQILHHQEEGAVLEGTNCGAGWQREGIVFVFAPVVSCLLSGLVLGCLCRGTWQSRASSSPAHPGREVFTVLTLKYINGALQGAVFTFVCRNYFFLVPGFSRPALPGAWLCDQEFCSFFVLPPWS